MGRELREGSAEGEGAWKKEEEEEGGGGDEDCLGNEEDEQEEENVMNDNEARYEKGTKIIIKGGYSMIEQRTG